LPYHLNCVADVGDGKAGVPRCRRAHFQPRAVTSRCDHQPGRALHSLREIATTHAAVDVTSVGLLLAGYTIAARRGGR
jgi:hypothetical protein